MKSMLFALCLLFGATAYAKRADTTFYAKCTIYRGEYKPGKKARFTLDIEEASYILPQINLFSGRNSYWAGLEYRYEGEKEIPVIEIRQAGSDRRVQVDLVVGQPVELSLSDEKMQSTVRCYNPSFSGPL